jgi:hypothetical protein
VAHSVAHGNFFSIEVADAYFYRLAFYGTL